MIKKIFLFSSSLLIFLFFYITCIAAASRIPDHKELAKLPDNPKPSQVTIKCLECHKKQAEDFIKTSHWLWKGPSPYTMKHNEEIKHGKATTTFNNY